MTNKEIKLSARKNISQNMGNCVSLTAFLFAVFVFLGLCELALFMLFKRIGWEYFFSWQGIKDHVSVRLFWFLDLIVIIPFASFEMWTVRRFFVDIARADSYVGSRQYINSHSYVYYSHTMFSSIIINSLKLFSAVPFAISTYSVYYWGWYASSVSLPPQVFFVSCSHSVCLLCFSDLWCITGYPLPLRHI